MMKGDWILLFDVYSFIFWSITYIECIRVGIKQKTYCVPLLAFYMNIVWESTCFSEVLTAQAGFYWYVYYGIITLLDAGILYTILKYRDTSSISKFYIKNIVIFIVVFAIFIFLKNCISSWKLYFAYIDNLIMSGLFILMYYKRGSSKGQSMAIAITKFLGTLFPILIGVITRKHFTMSIGFFIILLDVAYIILLYRTIQAEKAVVLSPKNKKKQNPS